MSTTLIAEIKRQSEENPTKPAFIFISQDWTRVILTFNDVYDLGQKFAARLQKLGLQPGDVVCNTVANSPERLITQVGTMMAGCIDMNGQLSLADGTDFISSLNEGSAKAVIYNPNDSTGAYAILKDKIKHKEREIYVEIPDVSSLKLMIPCILATDNPDSNITPFLEDLRHETTAAVFIDRGPDAVSTYMCTSGSTGFFKLVGFDGKSIITWGRHWADGFGITHESIWLNDRPLGWLGGYPCSVFIKGCTRVVVDWTIPRQQNLYTEFFLDVMQSEKCTESYTTPLQLSNLVREAKNRNSGGVPYLLNTVGVGSGSLRKGLVEAVGSIAKTVLTVYAGTETGLMACMRLSSLNDDYDDFICGWPAPNVEIKIVNTNMEKITPFEVGEILIKPAYTCSGYINNDIGNQGTFLSDGWVKLGDRGFFDDQGRLSVLGRGKNAIMRGPVIFYPELTEACLQRCPGVEGVAVVGVPDEGLFEEICALIVPLSSMREVNTLQENFDRHHITTPEHISNKRLSDQKPEIKEQDGNNSKLNFEKFTTGLNNNHAADEKETETSCDIIHRKGQPGEDDRTDVFTEEDVRKFCKENLYLKADNNDFSPMPRYFIFVESLPTLASGKLDRNTAKKVAADLVKNRTS